MVRYISALLAVVISFAAFAEGIGQGVVFENVDGAIMPDPTLRMGVLENSLTYYIKHNAKPKGQADFYILSDVGAIQEADDQQGLAHFLEHMAFNGTKNLPGKTIINYLERNGVKFGANLNAYTSWDVTVYMMKDVPVARKPLVDSVLLILHDWAGFIEPQVEEIDKERGVIKEELRTRDNADWRAALAMVSTLGRGTRYSQRNIIGHLDYLESFEPEALTRFYEEWYRPDYQAIIIVGDIDVDEVEREVQRLFADLKPAAEEAPQKQEIHVAESEEVVVEVFADPEMQSSSIQYFITYDAPAREEAAEIAAAKSGAESALIRAIQNERIAEVVLAPEAPIISGGLSVGRVGVIPTLEAATYYVQSPEGGVEEALRELVTQMERLRRHGVSEGEIERARRNMMRAANRSYVNRADRTNNSFVEGYMSNYRFGVPVPSAQERWQIDSVILSQVTREDLNRRIEELIKWENNVIFISSPQKEGLQVPTVESVKRIVQGVRQAEVVPNEEKVANESLLTPEQEQEIESSAGEAVVVKQRINKALQSTQWRLSNGMEVVVRPSTLKADEVLVSVTTEGGASIVSDEDYFTVSMLPYLMGRSGVAHYSAMELSRQMAGHLAGVRYTMADYTHGLSGSSSPEDLELLMQLLYLNLMEPRFNEEDLEGLKRMLRAHVENQMSDPDYVAEVRYGQVAYGGSVRKGPMTIEMVEGLQIEDFERVWNVLYRDADNFRFTFVGSVEPEVLRPLVERYLGALSICSANEKMSYKDDGVRPVQGVVTEQFEAKMEQPKVGVQMLLSGEKLKFSMRSYVVSQYLKMALDNLLLENVREEMGGTYGVRTNMTITRRPYENYALAISYDTNAEIVEAMQLAVFAQIASIAQSGVSQEQMGKSREYLLKSYGNMLEHNSGWLRIVTAYYNHPRLDYIADYERAVKSVSSKEVQQMAQQILEEGNFVEVVMMPEQQQEQEPGQEPQSEL